MSDLLGLLGLGLRGGNLVIGVDGVRTALKGGEVYCLVVASDASPRAVDKAVRLAQGLNTPMVQGPAAADIGARLGRPPVMVVGVRNAGLARGIRAVGSAGKA